LTAGLPRVLMEKHRPLAANKEYHVEKVTVTGLAEARRQAGYSQRQVAELTGLAVSQISKHENNKIGVSLATALRYAALYNVPLTTIFSLEE